jgi:hypothetical protein
VRQNVQSGPQQGVVNNLPVVLSAWDVVSWIAFRELQPRPDLPDAVDFTLKWGSYDATLTLEALEARSSDAPCCIWEPLALDGEKWNGSTYKHVARSPDGPKMLRWIVRQLRAKHGRVVSFREAATLLREEIDARHRYESQINEARQNLMVALRAGTLRAWGKRDARRGEPNPAAEHEAVAVSLFLDELVALTEWDTIGPDPEHPTAIFTYRGPTFRDVRFYTIDVLHSWPIQQLREATSTTTTVAGERRLTEWLIALMRTNPDSPRSKAATKAAATAAGLQSGERPFSRAWTTAIRESGATSWARPGRKS